MWYRIFMRSKKLKENMGNYLKTFENHQGYQTFVGGGGDTPFIRPNVSHCIEEGHVHYNPYYFPMKVWYSVTDDSVDTLLYNYYEGSIDGSQMFTSAIIDGSEVSIDSLDANEGKYHLSNGEHLVEFFLIDNDSVNGQTNYDDDEYVDYFMFDYCTSITKLEIPMGVRRIGGDSLRNIPNVTEIVVPSSVREFGFTCFAFNYNLENINIPEGVTLIEPDAVRNCESLEAITIPQSVKKIDDNAFLFNQYHNPKPTFSVTLLSEIPPTIGNGVFYVSNQGTQYPIYVPSSAVETYKAASGWSDYASRIQAIP